MTPSEPKTVEAAREEVMHNTPERWKHLQRGRLDAFEAAVRRDERGTAHVDTSTTAAPLTPGQARVISGNVWGTHWSYVQGGETRYHFVPAEIATELVAQARKAVFDHLPPTPP